MAFQYANAPGNNGKATGHILVGEYAQKEVIFVENCSTGSDLCIVNVPPRPSPLRYMVRKEVAAQYRGNGSISSVLIRPEDISAAQYHGGLEDLVENPNLRMLGK
jgi:hypothetical protein